MTRRTRIIEATAVAFVFAVWFVLYCAFNPPATRTVVDCNWSSRAGTSCLARGHSVAVCCFNDVAQGIAR